VLGVQTPRYKVVPPAKSSAGQEAIELAESAGLVLDPWEADVLEGALGERSDGTWAAFEVGLIVPRQNGKGAVLEARELAGLFLFGEELILHSAHEFKTAAEGFRRILTLIQNCPDLDKRVGRVRTSHGEEAIELRTGQRLRFVARSTGSGRGFSGDTVILDEAYNLSSAAISALLPTMAARPNPQLWYPSSAPLPRPESDTLRRLCRRGRTQATGRLAYFEWCADMGDDQDDPQTWAKANPALGIRIAPEFVASEKMALDEEDFERERLGIFPESIDAVQPVIAEPDWNACKSKSSVIDGPVVLAFEVSMDRRWAVIAASGPSGDGRRHVEVIEHRRYTGWVVQRLAELVKGHHPLMVAANPSGPAGGLLDDCAKAGIEVTTATTADLARACGAAYDEIIEHRWAHIDQAVLNSAVNGAARRDTGDAWVFDRRGSTDISPLVAVTLAAWAARRAEEEMSVDFFSFAELVAE